MQVARLAMLSVSVLMALCDGGGDGDASASESASGETRMQMWTAAEDWTKKARCLASTSRLMVALGVSSS